MRKPLALMIWIIALLLSSCNFPRAQATEQPGPGLVQTYAAQTLEALGTQLAETTPTAPALPATSVPTAAPIPVTLTPTIPAATATTAPTATVSIACDRAGKVVDVNYPDGTTIAPGATFTKTWEIQNMGSCAWNSAYALVFANDGNAMNGPASKQLTSGTVAPNQKVQVSVDLKAPTTPGTYRGYWKLRNGAGVVFGTGPSDTAFWVEIKVVGSEYSFINNYCSATWTSNTTTSTLPCNGNSSDTNGFVIKVAAAHFGPHNDDEPGLWTNPPSADNSEIRGTYPAVSISNGNRFKAFIGCQSGATSCNVKFKVNYKADGGAEQTLGEWSADINTFTGLNVDISSLAGKSVQFILIVQSNGPSNQDQGLWMQPRITS